MDVQTISTAIASVLETALGIRVYDYAPDTPDGPAAFIFPDTIDYAPDYDQDTTATFVIRLLVPTVSAQGGQKNLNKLISNGTGSVIHAVRQNLTFNGAVQSTRLLPMRRYGVVQLGDAGTRYFSAEIPLEVYA